MSLSTGKKVTRRKLTEMPITNSVIRRIDSLSFKNRKGEEYTFDNKDKYEMIVKARTLAPFPI